MGGKRLAHQNKRELRSKIQMNRVCRTRKMLFNNSTERYGFAYMGYRQMRRIYSGFLGLAPAIVVAVIAVAAFFIRCVFTCECMYFLCLPLYA